MGKVLKTQDKALLGWGGITGFCGAVTSVAVVVDFLKPLGWSLFWLLAVLVALVLLVWREPGSASTLANSRCW